MKDILMEIVAHKRKEIAGHKDKISFKDLELKLKDNSPPALKLSTAVMRSSHGIIAEFKRRSPSRGWINQEANVSEVVKDYEKAGAAALSVLTDETYFGGTFHDLETALTVAHIPVMRKEFIVDEYQVLEAKLAGASAILLIAAALTKEECRRLTNFAMDLQMEVLLELHDETELAYVLTHHNMVGINNRNLGTFVTDVDKSFRMIEQLPKNVVKIAESGISSPSVLKELKQVGFNGFLIGEAFMKTDMPGACLKSFVEMINV